MSRQSLVDILVRRDGISRQEAQEEIEECADALENGDTEAIQYYLGLEDDYILDVLGM